MAAPENMRAHATACRAMAARESDPALRRTFLDMAERWDSLADLEEQATRLRASVDRSPPKER